MNDIVTQYRTFTAGALWTDKTVRGRLRFDGADRVSFLQALMTNEIAAAQPGSSVYTAYLTPQGRMIADLHVFIRSDHVLADVPASAAASLAATFDKLIFAEDVTVSDQSDALRQFSVIGARAGEMLRSVTVPGFTVQTDDFSDGSVDVFVPADQAAATIALFESAGIVQASPEFVEALRIDEGRPQFGVDMTTETIPLEAGLLDRAISQAKGCYVGQEVIVRILHRGAGRVAKRLACITFDSADAKVPVAGDKIAADSNDVGSITSAAWSPRSERVVALGYVSRDAAEPGRSLVINGQPATITKLAA